MYWDASFIPHDTHDRPRCFLLYGFWYTAGVGPLPLTSIYKAFCAAHLERTLLLAALGTTH